MIDVTLRYFDGCPNWERTARDLEALADDLHLAITLERVETPQDAERLGFRGSPTVLIDGRDPFATGDEPVGLACRIYDTPEGPAGAPTRRQLRRQLAAASAEVPENRE